MMRRLHPLLCAAVIAMTMAGGAFARVSWLQPGFSHGPVSAGQPGWDLAYKSSVRINGGRGELETLGVNVNVATAAQALQRAYSDRGGAAAAWAGGRAAWGIASVGGSVVRWLAVQTASPRACIVFRLTQSREDAQASLLPVRRHQIEDLPALPEAQPSMFLADDDQGWNLEYSTAPGDPADVGGRMDSAMASQGWLSVTPRSNRGDTTVCGYRRGGRTAWIHVSPDPKGGVRVLRMVRRE